jgi:hypothetical protein
LDDKKVELWELMMELEKDIEMDMKMDYEKAFPRV